MNEFEMFVEPGILGFYQSCEITEIYMCRKADKKILNLYTLVVFEDRPFDGRNKQFIGSRIRASDNHSIGIRRYWTTVPEAKDCFDRLTTKNEWSFDGTTFSDIAPLHHLPKQFLPSINGGRRGGILKNNYHAGSYVLESFDEEKRNAGFLLDTAALPLFNTICEEIANRTGIQISTVRDRVGNFIFQFPITVVDVNISATTARNGVHTQIAWDPRIDSLPDCQFILDAIFDRDFMGSIVQDYNKQKEQQIISGTLDQTYYLKLWRNKPGLLLYSSSGCFLERMNFEMLVGGSHCRQFERAGKIEEVDVFAPASVAPALMRKDYTTFVNGNLYETERKELERSLSFKQYKGPSPNALDDLRKLIRENDRNGVYLWDPFLRPADLFETLFFSKVANVPLMALCCINDTVKLVNSVKSAADAIIKYSTELNNPTNNNLLLNLEFRIQHGSYGWPFHDRFLIFPEAHNRGALVYSLGTSISSYGHRHHILQLVSHPQRVVDAFNELWDQLNHPECLIWKSPTA